MLKIKFESIIFYHALLFKFYFIYIKIDNLYIGYKNNLYIFYSH